MSLVLLKRSLIIIKNWKLYNDCSLNHKKSVQILSIAKAETPIIFKYYTSLQIFQSCVLPACCKRLFRRTYADMECNSPKVPDLKKYFVQKSLCVYLHQMLNSVRYVDMLSYNHKHDGKGGSVYVIKLTSNNLRKRRSVSLLQFFAS